MVLLKVVVIDMELIVPTQRNLGQIFIQENLEKDGLIKAERSIDIVLEGLVDLEVGEVAEVLEEVNNSIE
mgnify:FL=1|tara:strand:- start:583 stop:792 length:210 start_codon:yes stop_codon:yes gene_type:complete